MSACLYFQRISTCIVYRRRSLWVSQSRNCRHFVQTECLLPRSQHLAKVLNISKSLLSRCAPYFLSFFFPLFSPSLLLFYPYFHQSKIIISVLVPLALLVVIIHQTFSQFQCLIFLLHRHRTSRLLVCVCVFVPHIYYIGIHYTYIYGSLPALQTGIRLC